MKLLVGSALAAGLFWAAFALGANHAEIEAKRAEAERGLVAAPLPSVTPRPSSTRVTFTPTPAAVPTATLHPHSAAIGKPVEPGSTILVPETAIDHGEGKWSIPDLTPADVVGFYQSTLPAAGWKIDERTSKFTMISTGDWIINFCRPSSRRAGHGVWAAAVIRVENLGSRLTLVNLPDDDAC